MHDKTGGKLVKQETVSDAWEYISKLSDADLLIFADALKNYLRVNACDNKASKIIRDIISY